jgi:hypothetical protein
LAVSGLNPLNEAYFRFLAQSSRSKSTIQIVMNVGSRPIAVGRRNDQKWTVGNLQV